MLLLLLFREGMGIALPWPGSLSQRGPVPCICFLREALQSPTAQDGWGEQW